MTTKKNKREDDAINRFGSNVRKHRMALGLTMTELAAKCDVDYKQISNMELGTNDPSLSMVVIVARGLGVTVGELVDA